VPQCWPAADPMSLVPYHPKHRRMWMVPRNKRDIPAWKIAQLLSIFQQMAGQRQWSGNSQLQVMFRRELERLGLKRPGRQRDENPGGDRTYAKQLECLGLVFKRPNKSYGLTLAGQAIVDGTPPLRILQTQLLRHQYPSAYGFSQNIWVDPAVRVKPFIFILELLRRPDIQNLSDEELIIPVVYGHNHDCLELCAQKIIALRGGRELRTLIDNPAQDLYTVKAKSQTVDKRLEDAWEIANTFSCYASSTNLVLVDGSERRQRIYFNPAVESLFVQEAANRDVFLPQPENQESFQRAYGRWSAGRDSRADAELVPATLDLEMGCITAQLRDYCETHADSQFPESFLNHLIADYGYTAVKVQQAAGQMLPRVRTIFDERFIELSTCRGDNRVARLFEEAICAIFRDRLHFTAEHTGVRSREGVGGYADIFIRAIDQRYCAILDAKSYSRYDLPAQDIRAMIHDYVPSYRELLPAGEVAELEFSGYVAGGLSPSIPDRLRDISGPTGIPCTAMSARKLLELASQYPAPADQPAVRRLLAQGGVVA
jgi:hypothetical protein